MFGVLYWSFAAFGLWVALMGFPGIYSAFTGKNGGTLDHRKH